MSAAILTDASRLSQAIRKSADPLRTLASVLGILAGGCDHDEMCLDLERAAADAQTYADIRDSAAEAKRAELEADGHRSMASRTDHLFDPEAVL